MEVKGRDTISGLPRRTTVTSIEVREALSGPDPADLRGDARRSSRRRRPRSRPTSSTPASRSSAAAPMLLGIAEADQPTHLGIPAKRGGGAADRRGARDCGVFLEKLDVFSRVLSSDEED